MIIKRERFSAVTDNLKLHSRNGVVGAFGVSRQCYEGTRDCRPGRPSCDTVFLPGISWYRVCYIFTSYAIAQYIVYEITMLYFIQCPYDIVYSIYLLSYPILQCEFSSYVTLQYCARLNTRYLVTISYAICLMSHAISHDIALSVESACYAPTATAKASGLLRIGLASSRAQAWGGEGLGLLGLVAARARGGEGLGLLGLGAVRAWCSEGLWRLGLGAARAWLVLEGTSKTKKTISSNSTLKKIINYTM